MGRNHSRLGIWALALMTSLLVLGANAAYADSNFRVHAGGQFLLTNNSGVGGSSDRVSFGLEGKCPSPTGACAPNGISFVSPFNGQPVQLVAPEQGAPNPNGNFEYHNHSNGLHAHGKITDISFGTASSTCTSVDPALAGKQSAIIHGNCPDGSCSQFQIEVVDGDETTPTSPTNEGDWVCNIDVTGKSKMSNTPVTDFDSADQLTHGDVEVRTPNQH